MEMTVSQRVPSRIGLAGQVVAVVLLIQVGLVLGALTGWPVMSPVLGMVVPLLAATWFLRRDGLRWRDMGFARRMPLSRFLGFTLVTIVAVYALAVLLLTRLMEAAGVPAPDTSSFKLLIEGNLAAYLLFLLPVCWGSAAFGEELLVRGFIMNRLECLGRSVPLAVVGQAAIFALAHFYQGIGGVLLVFAVGLIFGTVVIRCGRNLWPVIAAHGLVDTIGISSIYFGWGWV